MMKSFVAVIVILAVSVNALPYRHIEASFEDLTFDAKSKDFHTYEQPENKYETEETTQYDESTTTEFEVTSSATSYYDETTVMVDQTSGFAKHTTDEFATGTSEHTTGEYATSTSEYATDEATTDSPVYTSRIEQTTDSEFYDYWGTTSETL